MNDPKLLVDDDSPTLTFERPRHRPATSPHGPMVCGMRTTLLRT